MINDKRTGSPREVTGFYLSSPCEVWWIAESALNMSRSRADGTMSSWLLYFRNFTNFHTVSYIIWTPLWTKCASAAAILSNISADVSVPIMISRDGTTPSTDALVVEFIYLSTYWFSCFTESPLCAPSKFDSSTPENCKGSSVKNIAHFKQESLATGRTTLQVKFHVGDSLKYALTNHMDQFVQITFF